MNVWTAIRANWPISLILAAFILLGLAYSVVNPLHEATDELRHYRFVRSLTVNRRLPVQGEEPCRSQSHHPPLFYTLGAAATAWVDGTGDVCYTPPTNPFWAYRYWEVGVDNKNQYLPTAADAFPWYGDALVAHIVRALNVLIGAATVWLTWAMARTIWPRRPALAAGAAAFVAFNPMFLYMAGAINNDVIAAFSGALVTWLCLRLLHDPGGLSRRWGLALGGAFGVALLSKFNLAAAGALIAVAVTAVAARRGQWRAWLSTALWAGLATAVVAGWWFLRNQLLYGEPTGFRAVTELWGVRDPADSFGLAVSELPYAWSSLWGRFGFGQIPLPEALYNALAWLVAISLAGLALPLVPGLRAGDRPWATRWSLRLLCLNVLLFAGVLFNYMLVSPAGPMGRFFFPGLPALAVLTFFGLSQWATPAARLLRRPTLTPLLAGSVNAGLLFVALVALVVYLRPAYHLPAAWASGETPPNPIDAQFDNLVNLRGYELSATHLAPGEPLTVTLFWEVTGRPPGDFLQFVHLQDEVGALIAQRDTHPGLGKFPSSLWRPGDRFVDTITLYLPETTYRGSRATLSIGYYVPGAYRLAITAPDGSGLGDALVLATDIALVDAPADALTTLANPLDQNFNREIRLIGYAYDRRAAAPGSAIDVQLEWLALRAGLPNYEVQVLLVDTAGAPQAAGWLATDRPATAAWTTGQRVRDTFTLPIPADLPAGVYEVEVALRDRATGRRQNIVGVDGHWIDDQLRLAPVRVAVP